MTGLQPMRSLVDCEADAVHLHALLQGLEILQESLDQNASPASNAMTALTASAIEKAGQLTSDLGRIADAEGRLIRMEGAAA